MNRDIFVRNVSEEDFEFLRSIRERYRISWPLLIKAIVKFLKENKFEIKGL